jgi:hypothetical protein
MENKIFDDHQAFNRFQVMQGMRVNESGTEPSMYITEVKLKKMFASLCDEIIAEIFVKDELNPIAAQRHREMLMKKVESLPKENLFTALNIYLRDELELCGKYVLACKRTRKESEEE